VLGTPPAFVLSQDQTLHKISMDKLFQLSCSIKYPLALSPLTSISHCLVFKDRCQFLGRLVQRQDLV
uniref:hypothetical protein n=1 Tax=Desulforadius tongensis TaxID=1216062 RepID=UPI0019581BF4